MFSLSLMRLVDLIKHIPNQMCVEFNEIQEIGLKNYPKKIILLFRIMILK